MRLVTCSAEISRRGNIDEARQAFISAIQRSDLDWPEAIYDAFVQFENVHGDLTSLLAATKMVGKEQDKVTKRREKVAREQIEQYNLQVVGQATAPALKSLESNAAHADAMDATPVDTVYSTGPQVDTHAKR